MSEIRLLVVDDHPLLRAGLRTISEIAKDIRIVGEARNGGETLAETERAAPHIVLLDIRLPGESGIEICRKLKAAHPSVRVIFLTSYSEEALILSAMEAGADGYLLKENDTHRLVDAIREVMQGEAVFDARVTQQLAVRRSQPGWSLADLTAQEIKLLAEVAKGKTDKEAAASLGLTPKTARNYLDRVFAKLNVHTRTEAALFYARAMELRGEKG
jgi:DNA-binding NarL/FixJ family response regulator